MVPLNRGSARTQEDYLQAYGLSHWSKLGTVPPAEAQRPALAGDSLREARVPERPGEETGKWPGIHPSDFRWGEGDSAWGWAG